MRNDKAIKPSSLSPQEIIRTPQFDLSNPDNPFNIYITQDALEQIRDDLRNGLDFPLGTYQTFAITEDVLGPLGFVDIYGNRFRDGLVSAFWMRSTLNRGVLATRGASQRFSIEASVPGGDLEYYKLNYNGQLFKPLTDDLTFRLRTRLGFADAYGSTDELPFFENFYSGKKNLNL